MRSLLGFATALAVCLHYVSAFQTPLMLRPHDISPSLSRMQAELGSQLCKGSSVYLSNYLGSRDHTERWSTAAEGDVMLVVAPTCEKDVATVVKLTNQIGLPFLAINRGHGSVSALGTIRNGVLIKLNNLVSVDIAPDGKSAVLGGGVYTDLLLRRLAKENKVAATGGCGCVGIVGPGLGGGFGFYQGYFGLMADGFIEMDVVTADGSEITVSESSNPDLFWAMRGAGQNFGIVTKFRYKIFDYPNGQNVFHATYHFFEDRLEVLFQHLNSLIDNGSLPKKVNAYVVLRSEPHISTRPVFVYHFYYFGSAEQASPYVQRILDLSPIFISNASFPYKEVSHRSFQASVGDPICAAGISTKTRFPIGLKTYNISTNREIYNLFEDMITTTPALATSFVQFEAFPMQAVKAVDPASTAYAHREDDILVAFSTQYLLSAANVAAANKYGRKARQLFIEGARPMRFNAYSNYANGDETLEQIYGHESWRLEKLRRLKRKWDPNGSFRFFNPITGY
ncbi:MAG: hypothetical protein LQ339_007737 [Xanthoria mediterranea]|nr:MAG: hypothetical protein LQ339_007737 [Xanthoria mediterranea]